MHYLWVFRDFEVYVTVRPNRRSDCWARMGVFWQGAPVLIERRKCYCCRRRGHLANQCPHLAGLGRTWEQAIWDNKIAGDKVVSMGETVVHGGEIEWRKDDGTVRGGGWSEGEINQGYEEVYKERGQRSNEPGGEELGAAEEAEASQEEKRRLGEYLTPEFLDWLECQVSNDELESLLGPDPEGAEEC
ncbi:unnamed protein product [Gordionus sp. m RMFG-2023]